MYCGLRKHVVEKKKSLESNIFYRGLLKIFLFLPCLQHSIWLKEQIDRVETLTVLKDVNYCIWIFPRRKHIELPLRACF